MVACPECGAPVAATDAYCGSCGADLRWHSLGKPSSQAEEATPSSGAFAEALEKTDERASSFVTGPVAGGSSGAGQAGGSVLSRASSGAKAGQTRIRTASGPLSPVTVDPTMYQAFRDVDAETLASLNLGQEESTAGA